MRLMKLTGTENRGTVLISPLKFLSSENHGGASKIYLIDRKFEYVTETQNQIAEEWSAAMVVKSGLSGPWD